MIPGRPEFWWNDRAGRYVEKRTGRFVTESRVRQWVDGAIRSSERRVAANAHELRAGRITPAEWQRRMREEVKSAHMRNASAAKGGWARMTPADFGRAGAEIRQQYRHLERFTRQIENGLPLDGRFLQRAGMYARAGRATFHDVQGREMRDRGFTDERNVLAPADHCAGCVDMTALGWVPLGTLVPIGERDCLSQCRCRIRYRKPAQAA